MQVAPSGAAFAYGDSEFIAPPPPPAAEPEFIRPAPVAAPPPPVPASTPEALPQPGARSLDGLDPHAGAPGAGPQPEATPWAWAGEGQPLGTQGPGMLNALDIAPQIALQLRPQPEIATKPLLISEREPQPQPTPKPVPTMFGNLDGGLEGSIAFSTKPLQIKSAQTPIAKAAAEVVSEPAATAPAGPTEPKADKMELAALELLLAEPATQDLVRDFGGPLQPPPTGNAVADSIVARYGADLAGRLNQLATAQQEVQTQYLKALDAAMGQPGPQQPGSVFLQDSESAASPLPFLGQAGPMSSSLDGRTRGQWALDPVVFTEAWAQGDSPLRKAFATLHGSQAVQRVTVGRNTELEAAALSLSGQKLNLLSQRGADDGGLALGSQVGSRLEHSWDQVNPGDPPKLVNRDMVWFDPQRGWVTDPGNLSPDWLDRAMPVVFSTAMVLMTAGAGTPVATATGTTMVGAGPAAAAGYWAAGVSNSALVGTMAQAAVSGAIGSASYQLAANGKISFSTLLQSAVSGALTAGALGYTGFGTAGGSLPQAITNVVGRAGVQGLIQELMGGKFRDGAIQGAISGIAGEVTARINAQATSNTNLSASERSALNLLSRAAGSAIRALGNPNDPMTGFATDFLSSVMGPEAGQAGTEPITEDPLGDFIAANEQRWADRQAAFDQLIEAFGNPGSEDWGQGEQLAAGAGFNLGASAPASGTLLTADDLRHMEIDGVNASGAADIDLARRALAEIDAVLDHQAGAGPTRAGLYNELVLDRFRDLGSAGQREVLAALDDYANSLHSANENTAVGLTRGSMEARRADLAVRIAADFARQSGAIPDSARFMADARGGVDVGSAAMISAIIGRPVRNRGTGPDVVDGNAPGGRRLPANLSQQDRDAINAIARGPSDVVIVGNGTAPGTRLPQDVNVNSIPPDPMPLLGRPIGSSSTQNAALQADIDYLNSIDVTGSRVNQQQVNGAHSRVGINRPDYQGTLPSGRRIIVEYDTYGSNRGAGHATRVLNNDPNAIVILRRVN